MNKVWLTSSDIERAGNFNYPINLDNYSGVWLILERPEMDLHGRVRSVWARRVK
jgi:hypothetical protein